MTGLFEDMTDHEQLEALRALLSQMNRHQLNQASFLVNEFVREHRPDDWKVVNPSKNETHFVSLSQQQTAQMVMTLSARAKSTGNCVAVPLDWEWCFNESEHCFNWAQPSTQNKAFSPTTA